MIQAYTAYIICMAQTTLTWYKRFDKISKLNRSYWVMFSIFYYFIHFSTLYGIEIHVSNDQKIQLSNRDLLRFGSCEQFLHLTFVFEVFPSDRIFFEPIWAPKEP